MSLKVKLISFISMFIFVLLAVVVGVLAARQTSVPFGGNIAFNAKDVYAKVSATVSGASEQVTLTDVVFSGNQNNLQNSEWENLNLNFDSSATEIVINITIENLSSEIGISAAITDETESNQNIKVRVSKPAEFIPAKTDNQTNKTTFTITLNVLDKNISSIDSNYNILISLFNEEKAAKEIEVISSNETYGIVSGAGNYKIGDLITLSASTLSESDGLFLGWSNSTNPEDIFLSTPQHNFILEPNSLTKWYAIFVNSNEAQSRVTTIDGISYSIYPGNLAAVSSGSGITAESVTIPSEINYNNQVYRVFKINGMAFQNNTKIKEITFPETLISINWHAFEGCSALEKVNFPENGVLYSIDQYTFRNCSSLKQIIIPDYVQSIGPYNFQGCSSLETISLPFVGGKKYTTTNNYFGYIFGATSYTENSSTIPQSLKKIIITDTTKIPDNAFYGCSNVISIELPEGLENIGSNSMRDCSSLASIIIPSSVTEIKALAFYECSNLTFVNIKENSNLKAIGNNAFNKCSNLTEITLPESLTKIGEWVFAECSKLETITFCSTNPPTLANINSIPTNIQKIYVPKNCLELYKVADNWNNFTDKLAEIENV